MKLELSLMESRVLAKSYAEKIAALLSDRGAPYDERDQASVIEMISRMKEIVETLPAESVKTRKGPV